MFWSLFPMQPKRAKRDNWVQWEPVKARFLSLWSWGPQQPYRYAFVISISSSEWDTEKHIHERNRDGKRCGSDDGSGRKHLSSNVSGGYLGTEKRGLCVAPWSSGQGSVMCCIVIVNRREETTERKIKDICEVGKIDGAMMIMMTTITKCLPNARCFTQLCTIFISHLPTALWIRCHYSYSADQDISSERVNNLLKVI